ncbi:1-deoxy-D-xylulose-5-phosphate synthase [Bifidobacterium thermacidophilum]|uniref:1-deoxy-D-xylulose-5-phosphate synthase n=1 Tax=Bifidobacterium thermacidophilum TaxID=246618 RepID=UPI0026EE98DD|nr:1-deoxy-D-xylulose-5-phosphate synthase [Bifidobacterium thermacidophilum]
MVGGFLEHISSPADVKALDSKNLPALCQEIRTTLVRYGKLHGGHIGSNLGMVEATVALHRVFDSPLDKIVFDVSHQSYVHKMLTGRAPAYMDERLFGTVTGFTNPEESEHDMFVLGHTGTSISLACGLAKTRDLMGGLDGTSGTRNVIAVIGDGSLSSAIAFEGLNNAAEQGTNMIIVVNDNEMSIAEDFGGMYGQLARLRASGGTSQPNIFNAFGLDYRYVEDGNDVAALVEAFSQVKDIDHPIVIHIHTAKGLGLDAEDAAAGVKEGRCEANHWQDPLARQGCPLGARKHYGRMAMARLEQRFASEPGLVVISPATPGSNGITREFRERAGSHYVDTGITEEHAVAFASGIAKAGGTPVLATSATFFQRTFDQLQQELSLNGTPVTLLVFGAGISGADNTHSGAFDIPMFANIPGLTYLTPTSGAAFLSMLDWSTTSREHGAVAIRVPGEPILAAERTADADDVVYPRYRDAATAADANGKAGGATMPFDRYRVTRQGSDVAIFGLGNMYPLAERIAADLAKPSDDGAAPINATVIDPQQCTSLDTARLEALRGGHSLVVTLEDAQLSGGWGEQVTAYYANQDALSTADGNECMRVLNFGAAKEFTDRVPAQDLYKRYSLTAPQVEQAIRSALRQHLCE